MPFFSVLIRTKNRPNFLKGALESLTKQTFKDFEVIVVNDGGEDVGELLYFFSEDLEINIINFHDSQGKGTAANTGVQNSSGKYITLLDDDDIYLPEHLQILFNYITSNQNVDLCYTDTKVVSVTREGTWNSNSFYIHSWEFNIGELSVMKKSPIACSVCISKEAWDRLGGYNVNFIDVMDDWELYLRFAKQIYFHHINSVTTEYRLPAIHKAFEKRDKFINAIERIHSQDIEAIYPLDAPTAKELAKQLIIKEAEIERLKRKIDELRNK